jgi:hypothetical protein
VSAFETVMDRLREHGLPMRHIGGAVRTRGACHDGDAPDTVAISLGRDKRVLVHCHKCDDNKDFLTAIGLTEADLYDDEKPTGGAFSGIGTVIKSYSYEDANGVVRYYVDRYVPKTFRPRMADGSKGFPREARLLYRLPQVLATARQGAMVFVVEGEKDADNLANKTGVTATTMPGGTGMGWQEPYSEALVGAGEVVIIADNDPDGQGIKHAHKVAASLARHGVAHRIMFPAVGKDISDHLAAGLEFGDLQPIDRDPAQEYDQEPPLAEDGEEDFEKTVPERFPSLDWHAAFATDFSEIDWLPGKFMERGQQVAIVGDGKVGKSLFMHDWLWRAITGRSFLGDERRAPLRVLYFDRENGLRDIVTRMQALGANPDELAGRFDYRMFPKFSGGLDAAPIAVAELLTIVDETTPDVVVFDTVSRFIAGKENDSDTWLQFYGRVHAPLKSRNIAGTRLDHMGKDNDKGSRGSSAKSQDVDHVWEMTRLDEKHDQQDGVETITTQIKMKRTHTRTGLGDDLLSITRRGRKGPSGMWLPGETRHELTDPGEARQQNQLIQSYVDELLMKNVPRGLGRPKLKEWALRHGVILPGKDTTLSQIVAGVKAAHGGAE